MWRPGSHKVNAFMGNIADQTESMDVGIPRYPPHGPGSEGSIEIPLCCGSWPLLFVSRVTDLLSSGVFIARSLLRDLTEVACKADSTAGIEAALLPRPGYFEIF